MYTISMNYNVHRYRDLCVVMDENKELTNISQRTYSALMKVIEYIIETTPVQVSRVKARMEDECSYFPP